MALARAWRSWQWNLTGGGATPVPVGQPPPDDLLRHPAGVDVCGVDEVAAELDETVELGPRDLLAALVAERHRAQALRGHHRAGAAQRAEFHDYLPR